MSNQGDDDHDNVQALAELVNPTLNQLTEAIGQLIQQQQEATSLLRDVLLKQPEKENVEAGEATKKEEVGKTSTDPSKSPRGFSLPEATPRAETMEHAPADYPHRRLAYAPAAKRPGLCTGCGHIPCSSPVSDHQLTDALKAVKLLKAPEGGPFQGIADDRTGMSFQRE
ncbi:hypothetical protein Pmar_PMAR014218, partial [Perkinsus marinus ATCC 50983]